MPRGVITHVVSPGVVHWMTVALGAIPRWITDFLSQGSTCVAAIGAVLWHAGYVTEGAVPMLVAHSIPCGVIACVMSHGVVSRFAVLGAVVSIPVLITYDVSCLVVAPEMPHGVVTGLAVTVWSTPRVNAYFASIGVTSICPVLCFAEHSTVFAVPVSKTLFLSCDNGAVVMSIRVISGLAVTVWSLPRGDTFLGAVGPTGQPSIIVVLRLTVHKTIG